MSLTRYSIGFGLSGFGLILSVFTTPFCHGICKSGVSQEITQCFLLFLFIGIVLIVSGVGLILEK